MPDEMLTIRQAARVLRVRDEQVRKWVRAGELSVIDLGDSRRSKQRIWSEDLRRFLESRRVQAKPQQPRGKRITKARWF